MSLSVVVLGMSVLIALFGVGTDVCVGMSVHFRFQLRTISQLVFFLLWLPPTLLCEVFETGPENCCQCEVGSVLCLCPVALVSCFLYFVLHHMSMDSWVLARSLWLVPSILCVDLKAFVLG